MTAVSKPLTKRIALLIAIQHVRGKAGSRFDNLSDLAFAHRDAKELRDLLISTCYLVASVRLVSSITASHGYQADDIILMMDDISYPEHLWPTRHKILRQIDLLTSDVPEDCHFFFYFSGHGLEEDGHDRARMRADGRDEEIVCADGKPILDYILHKRLIMPLQKVKGSKLFALFDCCHSESLLDLQRGDGPNSYSRAWTIGPGQLFKDLATVIVNLLKLSNKCRGKRQNAPPPPRRASTKWRSPPTSETHEVGELSIICLSACRDGQLAHDDCERELTFTKCFMDAMSSKSNITWMELRDVLKELVSDIRARYEETCLQESLASSEGDESYEHWTQDPRVSASSHTDLTREVSF